MTFSKKTMETLSSLEMEKITEIRSKILEIFSQYFSQNGKKKNGYILLIEKDTEKNEGEEKNDKKGIPVYFFIKDSKIISCSLEKLFKDEFKNRDTMIYLNLMIEKAIENLNGDFEIDAIVKD
ncbi:MAG: hypothetical protein AAB526_03560 [Patescibacteria group bacterium]